MATVSVSDHINVPVEHAFRLFTDFERGAGRVSNIKQIEMLTPGPVRLGTRWRETREIMGVRDSAEMEITSFERNRTYTITHHKAGVRVAATFWFEPSEHGTKVSLEFDVESGGLPPGLLAPLGWAIAGKVTQVLSRDLGDFKRSLEA
jgi:carbon monoxide dehydrogenase subunit G